MGARRSFCLLFALVLGGSLHAQRILQQHVQVIANNVRLAEALSLVAREGDFKLSYNAAKVNGDSLIVAALNGTVEEALHTLVGKEFQLKETGEHIILLGGKGDHEKYVVTGTVIDSQTGSPLLRAYIHEVDAKSMATTDGSGKFELSVSGMQDRTALIVMRTEYHDTVVYVARNKTLGTVGMRKRSVMERVEPLCLHDRCKVEELGVSRLLVPDLRLDQSATLSIEERSTFQLSLIPNVGTNGAISGVVINKLSVNILAGYARGLEGFEVGGLANIENRDVIGMQIAGITNLVGRNTQGVQIAGGINHTMRSLEGVQISGISNTVWDTLSGLQISGGINVVKGGLRGTQISSLGNMATQNVNGVQVAGGVNITPMDVRKTQASGLANYARNVLGTQFSCGLNVAKDSVGGGQVGFAANYARTVSGGQFSFGANVVSGIVTGGQIGFGLNYAGSVTGGQFAFGANVVPGNVSAGQIGLGFNYAGTITGTQFTCGLNAVSGTAKGAQIGVVNFARKCEGLQLGVINVSDSLSGVSIGVLSFSLKGYHRIDLVNNDIMPLSVQFRTGTKGFHNILGYSPRMVSNERWGFLYGIGTEPSIGKNGFLNVDLTGEQVAEQKEWVGAVNIVGRFSLTYGHTIAGPLVISGGPVLNVLVTDLHSAENDTYLSQLPPSGPLFEGLNGVLRTYGWLGWKAALGVRF